MRPECIACMDDENYRERSKHCLKKILRTLRAHSLYHYCCSNIYNGDKVKMITRAAAAVTTSSTHYSSIRFLIGNSLTTKKSVPLNNTASKGLGSRGITTCTSSSRDSLMLRRRALNCQGGFIHNQAPLTEVSTASTTKLRCTTFVTRRSFSSSSSDSNPLTASKQRILKDHNYCVDLVRDRDREGYLCGLLMPADTQRAYFALQAFNVELASIKDGSVRIRAGADTSSLALQLKFQRWKDILEEIYDHNNGNNPSEFAADPVASSLTRAVHDKTLTRRFLERLLEAREADVEVTQLNTVQDVTRYAEESVSSRLYLNLECTGVRDDEADMVASHAGVGIGVLTNLRAAPFRIAAGEVPIPVELLPPSFPYGVLQDLAHDPETLWPDPQDEQDWKDAINQMALLGSGHLMKAQQLQGKIPKTGRPCLLPMIPHLHYLSKLESSKVDYDVFHPDLIGDKWDRLRVLMLLSRSWLTGVY